MGLAGRLGGRLRMCRNIRVLFNFEPPVTEAEIEAAALQYVRKVSGVVKPSKANERVFQAAVARVTEATAELLAGLETAGAKRTREEEAAKAKARNLARFGEKAGT